MLNAEPAFVQFLLTVEWPPLLLRIQAPSSVRRGCGFSATLLGTEMLDARTLAVTWSCVRTDLTTGDFGAEPCSSAWWQGNKYTLPAALPAGVYKLMAQVSAGGLVGQAGTYVEVRADAGPVVIFNEPRANLAAQAISEPGTRASNGTDVVNLSVTLSGIADQSCTGASDLHYIVLLRGTLKNSVVPVELDVRYLTNETQAIWGSERTVEMQVTVDSLQVGAEYRFQLLLSASSTALSAALARLGLAGSASWPPPEALYRQSGIWAYESPTFSRTLPAALELWVEPEVGVAARTLFQMRCRAVCQGCTFAYRYARARPAVADGPPSCSDLQWEALAGEWLELRPWSVNLDVAAPFLEGNFTIEVTGRMPDGSLSRACRHLEALPAAPLNLTDAGGGATQMVLDWIAETSTSLESIRSARDVTVTAHALQAITATLPNARDVEGLPVQEQLRHLFSDTCDSVMDLVRALPASVFAVALRRLVDAASQDNLLALAGQALESATRALGSLLSLTELWQTLNAVRSILQRNEEVHGLLGGLSASGGAPEVAPPLLGASALVLQRASILANSTQGGTISQRNASALVSATMAEVVRLGAAVAAAAPQDSLGRPLQVSSNGYGLFVSAKLFSGAALRKEGITLELPLDTIVRAPYPHVRIPPLGDLMFAELKANLSKSFSVQSCLGNRARQPLDALALVAVQWPANPFALITDPEDLASIFMVRDIRLLTCGLPVVLDGRALRSKAAEFLTEVPLEYASDRTTGYGSESQFRCVRWLPPVLQGPGVWTPDDCISIFRPLFGPAVSGINVSEGSTYCSCKGFWPGTWALEAMPKPPAFVFVEDSGSKSSHNLVTYASLVLFLCCFAFIALAAVGDFNLGLDSKEEEDNAARLLPWALDDGAHSGAVARAHETLAFCPMPMRSDFFGSMLTLLHGIFALCRQTSRAHRSPEVLELPQRRVVALAEHVRRMAMESVRVAPEDADLKKSKKKDAKPERSKWGFRRKQELPPTPNASKSSVASGPLETTQMPHLEDQPGGLPQLREAPRASLCDSHLAQHVDKRSVEEWGADMRHEIDAVNNDPYDAPRLSQCGSAASGAETPIPTYQAHQFQNHLQPPSQKPGPPPEGWIAKASPEYGGRLYWVNLLNGKSTWVAPTLSAVQEMSVPEMRTLLGPRYDKVSLRAELEDLLRKRIAERMLELQRESYDDDRDPMEVTSINTPTVPSWLDGPHDRPDVAAPLGGLAFHKHFQNSGVHRAPPPEPLALLSATGPPVALKPAWDGDGAVELRGAGGGEAAPAPGAVLEPTEPPAPSSQATSTKPDAKSKKAQTFPLPGGEIVFRFRLQFTDYAPLRVAWLCWIRTFPLVAALTPQLVRPRTARAALVLLRLSLALALATLVVQLQLVPGPREDVEAGRRNIGLLLKEMDTAMKQFESIGFGVACAVAAEALAGLLTPAPLLRRSPCPPDAASLPDKVRWWTRVRRRLYCGALAAVLLSAALAGGAGAWSRVTPQPRASVAAGIFVIAVLVDLLILPFLSASLQAALVGRVGRAAAGCSCFSSAADFWATQLPWLLDFSFAQVPDWTSAELLIPRLRLIVEEQRHAGALVLGELPPQLLGTKAKRLDASDGPAAK